MSQSAVPIRCHWARESDALMCAYHDTEWGVPLRDDRGLFEFLCLEGVQAGLSWRTVLAKRAHYRKVFHDFEIARVAAMADRELDELLLDPGIIRNRLKVSSSRDNAIAALGVIEEFGSLGIYLWSFVDGKTVLNRWRDQAQVPASTELSDRMSKALKRRGFRFVGSTICYSLMQATGMINDHLVGCFRHRACADAVFDLTCFRLGAPQWPGRGRRARS
ncbi:MAG: DNA-3-methyladenine glycosylase I [Rhodanobacter sp.]|nr:MAG: DNA-3-methyladenine glycosylase I [Rhodanobacter sp.]TAL96627.1 MAG: DNA-3-methyladenine glycosylase I [Rhodanobacter sp.]TAM40514.1 MAG: DNA-3-methyladenine glycosylase I [Rhodanobacter sp.]TAN28589.1 MAG: DNA-3-methyladenine glycosylase I [Rhodanobacter sp.]